MSTVKNALLLIGFIAFWPTFLLVSAYVGIVGAFAILAAICVLAWIVERANKNGSDSHWCAHGVQAGESGYCSLCREEQARQRSYAESETRKVEVRNQSALFRKQQISELRRKFLSRSESYFEMSPQQFEDAVAGLFRQLAYDVKQTPYSNDRGKDAVISKNGKKYVVECKRYARERTVGRRDLQILVAAMREERAVGGFYITTGTFARTVPEYAAANHIRLYDKKRLPVLVQRAFPSSESISSIGVMCVECGVVEQLPVADGFTMGVCRNGHSVQNDITATFVRNLSFGRTPRCDRCGARMRMVKPYRGSSFWGCTKYPRCRARKTISEQDRLQLLLTTQQ